MLSIRWSAISELTGRLLGKNRRELPRARTRNLVKCSSQDGYTSEHISNLIDFSETGLQFRYRTKIRPGSLIHMVINIAEKGRDIPVLGKVMWVKSSSASGYRIGVHFVEINFDDRDLLRHLVKRKLSKTSSHRR